MSFVETAAQILSLFIIIVIGYIMSKRGIIDDAASAYYTKLVLNISLPAQIISTFISNRGIVSNMEVIKVFGISAFMYAVYAVIGILFVVLTRTRKEQWGLYIFMMMFGNVAFMGFPVVRAILGEEAMIYAVIMCVVFNLLVFSLGIPLLSKNAKGMKFEAKKLLNMPLMAATLSVVLFFTDFSLPHTVMRSLEFMGNITTPVSMLILGAILARMKWKELFDEWRVYLFLIVKLFLVPLVVFFLLKWLPIGTDLMVGCVVLLSAMPVATNATMLALEYEGDVKLTSKCVFFTTVLCMITIPIITMLY